MKNSKSKILFQVVNIFNFLMEIDFGFHNKKKKYLQIENRKKKLLNRLFEGEFGLTI